MTGTPARPAYEKDVNLILRGYRLWFQLRGRGTLRIGSDGVQVRLSPAGKRVTGVAEVTQEDSPVDIVHARLFPPFMNWHLIVRGNGGVRVDVNIVRIRPQVLEALRSTGWKAQMIETWIGIPKAGRETEA